MQEKWNGYLHIKRGLSAIVALVIICTASIFVAKWMTVRHAALYDDIMHARLRFVKTGALVGLDYYKNTVGMDWYMLYSCSLTFSLFTTYAIYYNLKESFEIFAKDPCVLKCEIKEGVANSQTNDI